MIKYNLVEVNDDDSWDRFVEESPQGTIFSTSLYLSSISLNYKRFYIYKGPHEIKAALAVLESEDHKSIILDW